MYTESTPLTPLSLEDGLPGQCNESSSKMERPAGRFERTWCHGTGLPSHLRDADSQYPHDDHGYMYFGWFRALNDDNVHELIAQFTCELCISPAWLRMKETLLFCSHPQQIPSCQLSIFFFAPSVKGEQELHPQHEQVHHVAVSWDDEAVQHGRWSIVVPTASKWPLGMLKRGMTTWTTPSSTGFVAWRCCSQDCEAVWTSVLSMRKLKNGSPPIFQMIYRSNGTCWSKLPTNGIATRWSNDRTGCSNGPPVTLKALVWCLFPRAGRPNLGPVRFEITPTM